MEILYEVKGLSCSYNSDSKRDKVLSIEKLDIPSSKLVFILGSSGSGKSTLLETLGLMNNTISSGEVFFQPDENEIFRISELWKRNDERHLSIIRKKYLNFIFQNTNLMENFTAYENVSLSGMIKENKTKKDAINSARDLMDKVKLPLSEVGINTLSVNLSGGQRQRLAFVRALNNSSHILFGDEPTGNLDEKNAAELFELIKENVSKGLSAIVVSHDIGLALKYADQIVIITKQQDKTYGEILPENIINRETWEHKTEDELVEYKKSIRKLFSTNVEVVHKTDEKDKGKILNKSIRYRKLFFLKEFLSLAGRRYGNIGLVTLIMTLTFLSIGLGNGSLGYLNEKLSSAFVNWLTIVTPYGWGGQGGIRELKQKLIENDAIKKHYGYSNASLAQFLPFNVYNPEKKEFYYAKGRNFDLASDKKLLTESILNQNNIVKSNGYSDCFDSDQSIGVIVTQKFLREKGYPDESGFIYLKLIKQDSSNLADVTAPIPIRAIVKELPGKFDLLYTVFFGNSWFTENQFYWKSRFETLRFIFSGTANEAKEFKNILSYYKLKNKLHIKNNDPVIEDPEPHKETILKGFDFVIKFSELEGYKLPSKERMDSIFNDIKANSPSPEKLIRNYKYNISGISGEFDPDELSIYFNELDSVRAFANYVLEHLNEPGDSKKLEADTKKINDMENFQFLSAVTYAICYLIVLFGCVSISIFLFKLVKTHLEKVKMNIGTFKAIGLGNNESIFIYFLIVVTMIIISLAISILASYLIGIGSNQLMIKYLKLENGKEYFILNHINTYVTIGLVFITSIGSSFLIIRKILSKSPGDLIYNR